MEKKGWGREGGGRAKTCQLAYHYIYGRWLKQKLVLSLSLGLLLLVVGKRKSREGWLRLPPRYISVIKAIEIETNGLGSLPLHLCSGLPLLRYFSPSPSSVCVCRSGQGG